MSPELGNHRGGRRVLALLLLSLLALVSISRDARAAEVRLEIPSRSLAPLPTSTSWQRALLRFDFTLLPLLAPELVAAGHLSVGALDSPLLRSSRPDAERIARAAHALRGGHVQESLPLLAASTRNEGLHPLWCEVAGNLPPEALAPTRAFLCEGELAPHPDLPTHLLALLAERAFRTLHRSDALPILRQVDDLLPREGRDSCVLQPSIALTLERLRRGEEALPYFERMLDACEAWPDAHIRALYALALRSANRGDTERALALAEELLTRYPERTHADDTFVLIARLVPERARELAWRGIREHPDGDLVGELILIAARALEAEQARAFLLEVSASSWRDPAYQTAGRVEFELARLTPDAPCPHLETLLARYPWSFSADVASRRWGGATCPHIDWHPPRIPGSTLSLQVRDASLGALLQRLIDVQAWEVALDVLHNAGPETPDEHWLLAALRHRMGDYHRAHAATRWGALYGWKHIVPAEDPRWRIAYPEPWHEEVAAAAAATGVPASLIRAVMREESAFQPSVESFAGALGLMQVMPTTAEEARTGIEGPLTRERLLDPATNIRIGANYLAFLLDRHPGDIARTAAAYNAGPGRVRQWMNRLPEDEMDWIEAIPFSEAIHYTRRVMETERIHRLRTP